MRALLLACGLLVGMDAPAQAYPLLGTQALLDGDVQPDDRLPLVRALTLAPDVTLLSEYLPGGAIDFGPAWVPGLGLTGRYDFDRRWSMALAAHFREYTLVDGPTPDSRHQRDDFELDASVAVRPFRRSFFPWLELGYHAEQIFVANNQAPSLQRPVLFAGSQLFHGPRLGVRWEGGVWHQLSGSVGLDALPYVLAAGDATVASLSPLFGYGLRASLSFPIGSYLVGEAAYRAGLLTGYNSAYWRFEQGPVLALQGRF